jgi:hypothetical protein
LVLIATTTKTNTSFGFFSALGHLRGQGGQLQAQSHDIILKLRSVKFEKTLKIQILWHRKWVACVSRLFLWGVE